MTPILCDFASVHLSTPTATIVTAADGMAALRATHRNPMRHRGTRHRNAEAGRLWSSRTHSGGCPLGQAYERKIANRFGGQQELELVVPIPKLEPPSPSELPLFEVSSDEAAS